MNDTSLPGADSLQQELSFAPATVAGLDEWAAGLPLVNTPATATQLQQALAELTRLQAPAATRWQLIDTLRPLIYYACSRLDKDKSGNAPVNACLLLANLCDAYYGCWQDAHVNAASAPDRATRDSLGKSGHRFLSDMGRLALMCLHRFEAFPAGYWQRSHSVYALAESLEQEGYQLADDENTADPLSLREVYLRSLLFCAANTNQLTAEQLNHTYNALPSWVSASTLSPHSEVAMLAIDLRADMGPKLSKHLLTQRPTDADRGSLRFITTDVIAYELEAFLNEVSCTLPVPDYLDAALITHLVQAWSAVQERDFKRLPTRHSVKLCVGLRSVHYFLSGGIDFNEQVANTETLMRREINPFLEVDYEPARTTVDDDPWSQAHDLKVRIPINPNIEVPAGMLGQTAEAPARKYDHHEVLALDTSPGGYRVQWTDAVPDNVQVGDLVALREESDSRWCLAALRWISGSGEATQMGLKLLSPRAIPVAIRAIQKKSSSANFSRALLLPELAAIGQPATLITPHVPFIGRQKVTITRQGVSCIGMLMEPLLKTESFNQFTFRMLDGYLENQRQGRNIDALTAMTREDTTQDP